jgi:hypothetical protein
MTTLSDTITRVRLLIDDVSSARYSDDDLTEALRRSLSEYGDAYPNIATHTQEFAAAGREIALTSGGSNLKIKNIVKLHFPYDSASDDPWTHEAFFLMNVASVPTLHIQGNYIPQVGDDIKIYYSTVHTMGGLDSETVDSYPADHANILVIGAAALAALSRAAGLSEAVGSRSSDTNQLEHWGKQQYELFQTLLQALRAWSGRTSSFEPESSWQLDGWDTKRGLF